MPEQEVILSTGQYLQLHCASSQGSDESCVLSMDTGETENQHISEHLMLVQQGQDVDTDRKKMCGSDTGSVEISRQGKPV